MGKEKRVKQWAVTVRREELDVRYIVYATTRFDARLIAFAIDRGFPVAMEQMTEEHVTLALENTK
jgi:hypothetical protein